MEGLGWWESKIGVLLKRGNGFIDASVPTDATLQLMTEEPRDLLFTAQTPLGFSVRVTTERWNVIITLKHPVMAGRENLVRAALETPDEIRQSRIDPEVLLFYKTEATKRWTCAVAKRLGDDAFLITAYPTDAIKEGVRIWPK